MRRFNNYSMTVTELFGHLDKQKGVVHSFITYALNCHFSADCMEMFCLTITSYMYNIDNIVCHQHGYLIIQCGMIHWYIQIDIEAI